MRLAAVQLAGKPPTKKLSKMQLKAWKSACVLKPIPIFQYLRHG